MSSQGPQTLHEMFLETAKGMADRPALEVDGESYSYGKLRADVAAIAATLQGLESHHQSPALTGVLGQRSHASFVGILAALCSGHGYVPMLPSFPAPRIRLLIARSQIHTLIVDRDGRAQLDDVLAELDRPLTLLLPGMPGDELAALQAKYPGHRIIGDADFASAEAWQPPQVSRDDIAYLLFTSGSTGEPKGVKVAHRNILRFLDVVCERYQLSSSDRFSHMFDTTFDLSLFDMFATWKVGGCLVSPDARARLLPAQYVNDQKISVWFSVPSTALLMKDMRGLTPGSLPGLRVSLFCGEALTVPVAEAWAAAAGNSLVENIYGPTELTLACTHYRWTAGSSEESANGVVPIGDPFAGMRCLVVDEQLEEVPVGASGELLMTGPQVALGYWNDEARTAQAFMVPPGESDIFYRTGDRVERNAEGQPMIFLGRMDQQIKINGYRVELGEVEAAIRNEAGLDSAVAIGWPRTAAGARSIVAFVDRELDTQALTLALLQRLPKYMVPKTIHTVESFPLNANGKIDRKALAASLDNASDRG